MPIPAFCKGCKARLQVPETAVGKRVKCPRCEQPVLVIAPSLAVVDDEYEVVAESPPARRAAVVAKPVAARVVRDEDEEDDYDDERPRKRKPQRGNATQLIVMAALLLVIGGVAATLGVKQYNAANVDEPGPAPFVLDTDPAAPKGPGTSDKAVRLKALEGEWGDSKAFVNGQEAPGPSGGLKIVGNRVTGMGDEPATLFLDDAHPTWIDFQFPDKQNRTIRFPALYKIENDELHLVSPMVKPGSNSADIQRPDSFDTANKPAILIVSKRLPANWDATVAVSDYPKSILGRWRRTMGETIFGFSGGVEFTADGKVLTREAGKWQESGNYRFEGKVLVVNLKINSEFYEIRYDIERLTPSKLVSKKPMGELVRDSSNR